MMERTLIAAMSVAHRLAVEGYRLIGQCRE
jgi:hypothetical protein